MSQQYNVYRIQTMDELERWLPFFREGHAALLTKGFIEVDYITFLKIVLECMTAGDAGCVQLVCSKNDKPHGFGVAFNDSKKYLPPSFYIYAVYSSGQDKAALLELQRHFEQFLRSINIRNYNATCARHSTPAIRCFSRQYTMKPTYLVFNKEI